MIQLEEINWKTLHVLIGRLKTGAPEPFDLFPILPEDAEGLPHFCFLLEDLSFPT